MKEYEIAYIMRQICSSVYYCHFKKICHRDIKLDSFLIESIEKLVVDGVTYELPILKLLYFNSAKTFKRKKLTKKVGTVKFFY